MYSYTTGQDTILLYMYNKNGVTEALEGVM